MNRGRVYFVNSKTVTKIHVVILAAVIVVATVAGIVLYVLWGGTVQSTETIKIGVLADLDNVEGRLVWQAAVLAAEHVNAEGGVLGRDIEIVSEDDDSETSPPDPIVASKALTKLITVDQADYIIDANPVMIPHQDICSEHKKILFSLTSIDDELTQRVLDDYDKYKYYFRGGTGNMSTAISGITDTILALRNYTGFDKIALLYPGVSDLREAFSGVSNSLLAHGFDVVYSNVFPMETEDFTSYFMAIEASGAEILYPFIIGHSSLLFVKEWHERQSPTVVWGFITLAEKLDFWELTEGKCESVSFSGYPIISGYPLTSKTLPTREAYLERWGEVLDIVAASTYDIVRFILPDAIKRAGTLEIDAVIEALEETDVETSLAHHFVYTSSHDIMRGKNVNDPEGDYMIVCKFQWQNGVQVLVYPTELMEEAGATYTFPPWSGPWDELE
jgi:branched-chain amino acid transport system substrate-binding protein